MLRLLPDVSQTSLTMMVECGRAECMSAFNPMGAVEEVLMDRPLGVPNLDRLFEAILKNELAVLVEAVPEDGALDAIQPLILVTPARYRALAVFSNDQRAAAAAQHFSQFPHAMILEGHAVLTATTDEIGWALNPGAPSGLDISPAELATLKARWLA